MGKRMIVFALVVAMVISISGCCCIPLTQEKPINSGTVRPDSPQQSQTEAPDIQVPEPTEPVKETTENKEQILQELKAMFAILPTFALYNGNVSQWDDTDLAEAVYSILLNLSFRSETSQWEEQNGLVAQFGEDGQIYFDLDAVNKLTMGAFGREFPRRPYSRYIFVDGDKVGVEGAGGEYYEKQALSYTRQDDALKVIGTVFRMGMDASDTYFGGYFRATVTENPDSIFGYTLQYSEYNEGNQSFDHVTAVASSSLTEFDMTHQPSFALDGDLYTAWVEGAQGDGLGEWIELRADGQPMEVVAMQLFTGYHKSDALMESNGRPVCLQIEASDGYSQEVYVWGTGNVVCFTRPVTASWIRITILEVESGTKYDDTCISEIQLIGLHIDN